MSGKLSHEGVKEFKLLLQAMSVSKATISKQDIIIRDAQAIRFKADNAYTEAYTAMLKLMRDMDVAQNGNTGWPDRVAWFMVELYRQIRD